MLIFDSKNPMYVDDAGNEWDQCLRCRLGSCAVVHWSFEKIEIYNQLEKNGFGN